MKLNKWWNDFLTESDRERLHKELNLSIAFPANYDDLYLEDQEKVNQAKINEDKRGYKKIESGLAQLEKGE